MENQDYEKYNDLEKLSAVMKGLIEYKQEIEMLEKLIKKYPKQSSKIFVNTRVWFAAYA
jgi:hypothetical protein